MTILSLLAIVGIWLYIGWLIQESYRTYRERKATKPRKYSFRLHHKPPDASEPKRRTSYRPPKK